MTVRGPAVKHRMDCLARRQIDPDPYGAGFALPSEAFVGIRAMASAGSSRYMIARPPGRGLSMLISSCWTIRASMSARSARSKE
jgi:hypothetical protein